MIHIFFDSGSFGSTIEYVIRNFTNHAYGPSPAEIAADGSMHHFSKQYHINSSNRLKKLLLSPPDSSAIISNIYPLVEFKFVELVDQYRQLPSWKQDTKILIYQPDLQAAELNLLFKYHKICNGTVTNRGLEIIVGDNQHNLTGWNTAYTHWTQMQPWELREWLSLFYPDWLTEIGQSYTYVDESWLVLSNIDVLYNTACSFKKIIDHCNLTVTSDIDEFVARWKIAQQYIVDEFELLNNIVENCVSNDLISWQPINLVAEAIVQQRLRTLGYEIRCDGLNTFPTDSKTLYNLLEKV